MKRCRRAVTLKGDKVLRDADQDGMPDQWEKKHKLNAGRVDGQILRNDGYSNLENYINELTNGGISDE